MEKRDTIRLNQPSKLIPKDISESLGKVPPSALDLEEVVLGALMLEKDAIKQVPYLQPQHFYDERHSEIFRAIKSVAAKGIQPDMRSVRVELSETGKIELIGGAYYIAQLTTAVSSAANIDHHGRKIVEMSMKRNLIQIASQIHHDAYEDTTDVFDLIKKVQEDIEFLEERETASSGPEKIKALWEKHQIIDKPVEQPPLVCIDETPVVSPGDHTLLVGKKKSRKSLLVVHLLWKFLQSRDNTANHILIFDTEQGKTHVWKTRDRLYRMTNQYVPIFYLRGETPKVRMEFITQTITHWPTRPKIVVIDGIRDCMSNINDPDETTEVISWLERLTLQFNIGIINILHLNKTDGNARGHIGSELLNKTVATIEVEYDKKTGNSIVKCESSREKEFDTFAFTHGPTGLPQLVGVPIGQNQVNNDEQLSKLVDVFEGEVLKYKDLTQQIMAHFAVGETKAKQLIPKFIAKGWILKAGSGGSPKSTYKLVAQPGQRQEDTPTLFDTPPPDDNLQLAF